MAFNLFTYGVLMHAELLQALLGEDLATSPARLADYQRYTLAQEGWPPIPAIVREPGASVPGVLIHDLDEALSELLDDFEDVDLGLYIKESVLVVDAHDRKRRAFAYVAGPEGIDCLNGPWDAEEFMAQHYEDYLNRIIPEFLQRWH